MPGRKFSLSFALLLGTVGLASAQTFGDSATPGFKAPAATGIKLEEKAAAPIAPVISDEELSQALKAEQEDLAKQQQQLEESLFVPGGGLDVLDKPTQDGSERGGMAVVEVDKEGYSRRAEKIFLYYDNFRMTGLTGSAACDARFIVLTNLDRKLVSLDIKLVWPELTTALSFSNVMPNTPTYLEYTLMGNGCYHMDKMPNIVVNRCRVRGMNSAECADKIVWLSAASAQ